MKKLLILTALLVSVCSYAAETSATITGGPLVYTSILTNRATIALLSVTASGANAVTASFYDSASTNSSYITSEYRTRTSALATNTTVYTNTAGGLATNIAVGISTSYTTNSAATNALPFIAVLTAPASGSVTRAVDLTLLNGLAVRTTTNCVVDVIYNPVN